MVDTGIGREMVFMEGGKSLKGDYYVLYVLLGYHA